MTPRPGRPREFKSKMRDELLNLVGHGASVEGAATVVGVSLRTVQREARGNDCFHHDLELAKHTAPTDMRRQMEQAARTQWRAAAWLLEREDPDAYGKRPANSCSPWMLRDACQFLIEKALEATPAEHRAAVYQHVTAAAEQMFAVIMPDQSINRRRLAHALAEQTSPLCSEVQAQLRNCPEYEEQERAKAWAECPASKIDDLLGDKQRPPKPSPIFMQPVPRWSPSIGKRQDGQERDAPWHYATPEEEEAYRDYLFAKKHPKQWADEQAARREWEEEDKRRAVADLKAHYQEERAKKQAARKAKAQEQAKSTPAPAEAAPSAACGLALPASPVEALAHLAAITHPNEGIMSPKMSFCDETPATKLETPKLAATEVEAGLKAPPYDEDARSPQPHKGLRALLARIRSKWQSAEAKPAA